MSIYSGFSLRKMQEKYNKYLVKLISLLQSDVIKFMSLQTKEIVQSQQMDQNMREKFGNYLTILNKLKILEQHKYLQPKFSQICSPLKKHIRQVIPRNMPQQKSLTINSTSTSRKSQQTSRSSNQKSACRQEILHQSFDQKYQRMKEKRNCQQSKSLDNNSLKNTPSKNCPNQKRRFDTEINFPIFTIQEVQENVSMKQFKKINYTQQISKVRKNCYSLTKDNKYKIYKSHNKSKSTQKDENQSDQPNFPSYHRELSLGNIENQEKQKSFTRSYNQQNQSQHNSCKNTLNLTTINQKIFYQTDLNFKSSQLIEFKKINIPCKMKFKSSANTPKSQQYTHFHYKKFVDRSDLKKLITQ